MGGGCIFGMFSKILLQIEEFSIKEEQILTVCALACYSLVPCTGAKIFVNLSFNQKFGIAHNGCS